MEILDTLYTAATAIKGRSAMKLFLRDVLTESERIMIGRKILIARLLLTGYSYHDVQENLGVGTATIANVHHWLSDQFPGYEKAIKGIEREQIKRKKNYEYRKSFANLKRKYPMHFIFFSWPKGFEPIQKKNS
jgi:uncharacterized protein YerC